MFRLLPTAALALHLALPATAQTPQDTAYALILPVLQTLSQGLGGEAMASCTVEHGTAEEIAAIAASPTADDAVGGIVSAILARQETIDCVTARLSAG